jgi:sulfatase modifying factor 1
MCFSIRPLVSGAAAPASSSTTEEAFDYYQDGKTGSGQRVVLKLDLGGGVTMDFVRIPAGKFQMGSPANEKERLTDEVQHSVELTHEFYMGKTEVTRGQFRAFVKDTGYKTEAETDGRGGWGYNESTGKVEGRRYDEPAGKLEGGKPKYTWESTGFAQTDEHPVVNVSWNDANAFCHWLAQRTKKTVRLPTEAE